MKNYKTREGKVNLVRWHYLNHMGIKNAYESGGYRYTYLDRDCKIDGDGVRFVKASGRAKCRLTGEIIPKGEWAIKGVYDFDGSGSYTCTTVYISYNKYVEILKFFKYVDDFYNDKTGIYKIADSYRIKAAVEAYLESKPLNEIEFDSFDREHVRVILEPEYSIWLP